MPVGGDVDHERRDVGGLLLQVRVLPVADERDDDALDLLPAVQRILEHDPPLARLRVEHADVLVGSAQVRVRVVAHGMQPEDLGVRLAGGR